MRRLGLLAFVLLLPGPIEASPARISEDQAINLVAKALRQLHPEERIGCLTFITEETSPKEFGVAAAENHKQGCGGDPGALTVVERFRVRHSSIALWRLDVLEDKYLRCRIADGRAVCPKLSYE